MMLKVVSMERIKVLFPEVSIRQWTLLEHMAALHREWNRKINLISRKDIDNLEWRHYAPCIAAVKLLGPLSGRRLLDVGTGGGLPGLILAVLYPEIQFTLLDSVGKKITVVRDIAERLELRNVETRNARVETLQDSYDFVSGRAVTSLSAFIKLTRNRIRQGRHNDFQNGILYWKGGSLLAEEEALGISPSHILSLEKVLQDDAFHEKFIVHYSQERLRHHLDN